VLDHGAHVRRKQKLEANEQFLGARGKVGTVRLHRGQMVPVILDKHVSWGHLDRIRVPQAREVLAQHHVDLVRNMNAKRTQHGGARDNLCKGHDGAEEPIEKVCVGRRGK